MISTKAYSYFPRSESLNRQGVGTRAAGVRNRVIKRSMLWIIVFTLLALFCVWTRVQVLQTGYEVTDYKRQSDELSKQVSNLEMEIARLKSPKRLEEFATQNLQMRPPSGEQIILVQP